MSRLIVAPAAVAVALVAAATLAAQGTTGGIQGAAAPQETPAPAVITTQKGDILQKVIVKVNGEIFTQTELVFRQIQTIRDQNQSRQIKPEDLNTDPGLRAILTAITPGILVDAVDELIVVQHGKEQGYKFSEQQFSRSLEDLKQTNKLDDKTFLEALKQEGITLAELRVNLERAWFINTVRQREIMRNMTLTEEEARAYYKAHQDEFMKPSTVTLREILIAVPADAKAGVSFGTSPDDAAKQKIAAVRERALKGEDYTALVAEVSESGTKASGGLIGPVDVADLNPAVADLLDKMKPGDITEPIRTKAGYQIIKLESRSAAEAETLEKSREAIAQSILNSRVEVEQSKFLERLLLQAVIEWKDDDCKKMYETERAIRLKHSAPKDGK